MLVLVVETFGGVRCVGEGTRIPGVFWVGCVKFCKNKSVVRQTSRTGVTYDERLQDHRFRDLMSIP